LFALLRPQAEDNQHAESLITRAYADADAIIRGTKRVDLYDLIMALVLSYREDLILEKDGLMPSIDLVWSEWDTQEPV
jgi:hypothetical protein